MEVLKPIQPTMKIATACKYHITRWKGVLRDIRIYLIQKQALKRIPPFKTRKGELKL